MHSTKSKGKPMRGFFYCMPPWSYLVVQTKIYIAPLATAVFWTRA